uniref:(northern house mosquito) hypothetical protein n=1 Tax=Culex pipiens TaxID=7175 RepID=A0A8D8H9I3_CULPI
MVSFAFLLRPVAHKTRFKPIQRRPKVPIVVTAASSVIFSSLARPKQHLSPLRNQRRQIFQRKAPAINHRQPEALVPVNFTFRIKRPLKAARFHLRRPKLPNHNVVK